VRDRDVAAVDEFIAVVLRHELIEAHARLVHPEPNQVSYPHMFGVGDRLEVRQVTCKLERLEPGGNRITEQVASHQVSQRHAVQAVAQSVLTTADTGPVLGPHVPERGIKIAREHLIPWPTPPLTGRRLWAGRSRARSSFR
jgi:hypothetical protein